MSWWDELTPNEYVGSVHEIDVDGLWSRGFRLLLTDLDNTLVAWNDPEVSSELREWLQKLIHRGFQVCIVSNNSGPRVKDFANLSGVPYIAAAKKPKPEAFHQALARFGATAERAVMVGDQLFTDIRGGNRAGLYTVLVLPLHPREWWGTKVVRFFERFAMRGLVRRGLRVPVRKH